MRAPAAAPVLRPPPPPRSPWQLLYGALHGLRRGWYARRAGRLPRPVLSIGNLGWGGSGKTPLVAAVAAHLRDRSLTVAILSRGYRRRGRGVRVVSAGDGPLLGPRAAGDEPVWLAGQLPGVAVVVGPDRLDAGLQALERLRPSPQIFLLDDGFSHLRLHRDLDLLAFPADDPFAGGRLPPGGRLREPLASAAHADAAVLTGAAGQEGEDLARGLRPYGFAGPGFASRTRVLPARLEDGKEIAAGSRVLAVAAIARPERFLADARELGYQVAGFLPFPDHFAYPGASLEQIRRAWRASGAACLLTTGKDRVKLLGRLDLPVAELPVRAEPEPAFWHWLDGRLEDLPTR